MKKITLKKKKNSIILLKKAFENINNSGNF